jgi:hypothetical protein
MQTTTLISSWKEPEQAYAAGNREWIPCTEPFYHETLNVLPPVYIGNVWACSEPWKDDKHGRELLLFFRHRPEPACRMATRTEIQDEIKEGKR